MDSVASSHLFGHSAPARRGTASPAADGDAGPEVDHGGEGEHQQQRGAPPAEGNGAALTRWPSSADASMLIWGCEAETYVGETV